MKTATLNYTALALLVLASLYYISTNVFHYFDFSLPANHLTVSPFRALLLMHIAAGTVAILTGPFQFIPVIRNRYRQRHRSLGKVYLVAILIGSLTGLYLAIFDNILTKKEIPFGTGVSGLSIAWLLTSGMAFWAIKNGNIAQHRDWMIKSYVVTCGFTTFRLMFRLFHTYFDVPAEEISGIVAWACWAVPLLITDVVLQAQKLAKRPSHLVNRATIIASLSTD